MSYNVNWVRWVRASVYDHLNTELAGKTVFFEGTKRNTSGKKDYFEVRMDGPQVHEESKNYWRLYIEVSVVIASTLDESDAYRYDANVGLAQKALSKVIKVYKYGTNPGDDQSQIGCFRLVPRRGRSDQLEANNFGQIDPDIEMQQGTVEGHYEMFLKEV